MAWKSGYFISRVSARYESELKLFNKIMHLRDWEMVWEKPWFNLCCLTSLVESWTSHVLSPWPILFATGLWYEGGQVS